MIQGKTTDEKNIHQNEVRLFQRIVVGVDPHDDQLPDIVRLVANLSRKFQSFVILCHVSKMVTNFEGNESDGFPVTEDERKSRSSIEENVHKFFDDNPKQIEIKILHGDPAERLVEHAEFSNCDLIVMGSHTRGELKRVLLGSVSGSVAAKTRKSVLIAK